ncbi:MAG: DUF3307 domain-containing protein [Actinobacteria bacterium]|nr:DUF3307 domain-containing protein [Actinomycetota bacterium]MBI3688561.1 DUF3307 domain-containing protein [Actinomycetota bacterium]
MSTTSALVFAVTLPALLVAHSVADHWVQTHHQALTKGAAGWVGRMACARHVASYTATTAATVGALVVVLDLPVSPWWVAAGQLVSAVSHYWADRRSTLRGLAERTGKAAFYALGAPRAGRDDNPSLGTGAYALDQSWHHAWLLTAALLTAVGAS